MKIIRLKIIICAFLTCLISIFPLKAQENYAEKESWQYIQNLYQDHIYWIALEEIEQFLKKYPGSPYFAELNFLCGKISILQKKINKALQCYQNVLTQPTSSFYEDALYFTGTLQIDADQIKQGRQHLEILLQKFPQTKFRKKLQFYLGQIAFSDKKWSAAKSYLERAQYKTLSTRKQKILYQYMIAWINDAFGYQKLAQKAFHKLVKKSFFTKKQKALMIFQLGTYSRKSKKYRIAIKYFRKQLKLYSDPEVNLKSRFWIAELFYYLDQQKNTKISKKERWIAIKYLTQNLKLTKPFNIKKTYYYRGWLYYNAGNHAKSLKDFFFLQQKYPQYAEKSDIIKIIPILLKQKIYPLIQKKQWKTALSNLLKLIKNYPHEARNPETLLEIAKCYKHLAQQSNATKYYEQAYRFTPAAQTKQKLALLDILGAQYEKSKKFSKMIKLYKNSLSLIKNQNQKNEMILFIGKAYFYQLKSEIKAKYWLKKLHQKGKTNFHYEATFTLAEIELSKNQYAKAIQYLKTLDTVQIKKSKWYLIVQARLAELYHYKENWKKALTYYQNILAAGRKNNEYYNSALKQKQNITQYLQQITSKKSVK